MNKAFAVIDLAYGDSGKGILVARLCASEAIDAVVRFSGGCQAAHNVITDDGRHHTFKQFGSGTFSGVPTYLSRHMMFEPFVLQQEAYELEKLGIPNPISLISVAWDALLTTPYHQILNQWLENSRGENRHGSTGRGIGATAWYASEYPDLAPRVFDMLYQERLTSLLSSLREWVLSKGVPKEELLPTVDDLVGEYAKAASQISIVGDDYLHDLLRNKQIVFEGSQGVLLDEHVGFFPYVTRTETTTSNIYKLYRSCNINLLAEVDMEFIGVIRSYTTRHGFGPFPTEDSALDLPEPHNKYAHWMGGWRVGHLDIPGIEYAIGMCNIDSLYITHMDKIDQGIKIALFYTHPDHQVLYPSLIDRYDFQARTKQSELLKEATAELTPMPAENAAELISGRLGLPLRGIGTGPAIGDGVFYEWKTPKLDLFHSIC